MLQEGLPTALPALPGFLVPVIQHLVLSPGDGESHGQPHMWTEAFSSAPRARHAVRVPSGQPGQPLFDKGLEVQVR